MTVHRFSSRQRGVALFVGLVFLIVLSLVAITAMKGTLIEMRMGTSTARHEQAFETSETLRAVPVSLFDEHVFERGWPATLGGDLPDADFDYQTKFSTSLLTSVADGLQEDCSGSKTLLYAQLQTCDTPESLYNPSTWHPDLELTVCDVAASSCSTQVKSVISVVPDGQVLAEGSGGAQSAGYRGLGVGAAGGGASMYFEIRSVGSVPGNGVATTHSQYRQTIRN